MAKKSLQVHRRLLSESIMQQLHLPLPPLCAIGAVWKQFCQPTSVNVHGRHISKYKGLMLVLFSPTFTSPLGYAGQRTGNVTFWRQRMLQDVHGITNEKSLVCVSVHLSQQRKGGFPMGSDLSFL